VSYLLNETRLERESIAFLVENGKRLLLSFMLLPPVRSFWELSTCRDLMARKNESIFTYFGPKQKYLVNLGSPIVDLD
jgi:hypothetical protein